LLLEKAIHRSQENENGRGDATHDYDYYERFHHCLRLLQLVMENWYGCRLKAKAIGEESTTGKGQCGMCSVNRQKPVTEQNQSRLAGVEPAETTKPDVCA